MLTKKDAGIISTIQLKLQQDKFTQLIPVPKFLTLNNFYLSKNYF